MSRLAAAALAAALASGCFSPTRPDASGVVRVAPPGEDDRVELTYLGVGGWIFRRGDARIMAAPLFTNPSLLRTGLAEVRSDTAAVDRGLAPYDLSGVSAILSGHAHYDHLMDVPRTALRHAPGAVILGSRTVRYTLGAWSGVADRVVEIDSAAADQKHPGRWIPVGHDVRVLPLRSNHAAHFNGFTLYHGARDRPLEEEPRWATEWLDGPTYAFLIDFLDPDGTVAFRIYYQDAVSAAPFGFAPEAEMAARPVDAAVLVPSTFDQVDWHPEAFIDNLRPRWVLLGHWEDFFVPPERPPESLPLTDIGHFRSRLRRVFEGESWLPAAGTRFVFPAHPDPRSVRPLPDVLH